MKKKIFLFVRSLGGDARYSGKERIMNIHHVPFAATVKLIRDVFPSLPFEFSPEKFTNRA